MRIGIPREEQPGETLVSATPKTAAKLISLGYEVVVEAGAGAAAKFPDEDYVAAGATIGSSAQVWAADIVTKVNEPTPDEVGRLAEGATIIDRMTPDDHPELVEALQARRATGLNLLAIPRISRAQSMDVLSTMSNIAGYRGVIEAAESYGGMFAGQVTAAGKTQPATVFIIGAGVAGLAAIGAAVSLGAQVRAFDVRPEVGEQIESMGATFVQASAGAQQQRSADGYAQKLTEDQEAATRRMYAEESAKADIVITTALVRGWAPTTITAEMVANMKPGSIVVDLAAVGGGNCEATVPGEKVVTEGGVTIIGYTDLTSRMPAHTSQLYGTNIVNLMRLLTPGKDGQLTLDMDDVVQRAVTVTHAGQVLWPPPPVQVSAAPKPAGVDTPPVHVPTAAELAEKDRRRQQRLYAWFGVAAVLVGLAITFSPASFLGYFTVFVLAVFVGFYVITNVTASLHTPLMAQTNAISGIILVGALLQLGSTNVLVVVLAFIAATVASINIFGGFAVAGRMISMFRKDA